MELIQRGLTNLALRVIGHVAEGVMDCEVTALVEPKNQANPARTDYSPLQQSDRGTGTNLWRQEIHDQRTFHRSQSATAGPVAGTATERVCAVRDDDRRNSVRPSATDHRDRAGGSMARK